MEQVESGTRRRRKLDKNKCLKIILHSLKYDLEDDFNYSEEDS